MAVVLVVVVLGCLALVCSHLEEKSTKDREMPEEVLARWMPSEYPAYKKSFEMQAKIQANLPLIRP